MKKKVLLSSLLTIALCLSIVAGSTYAIFTSESSVNVAVTAGKVSVAATIDDTSLTLSSMGEEMQERFENGGTAGFTTVDGVVKALELSSITPGDSASFTIHVTNTSNVRVKYRVSWTVTGELMDALVATADGNALVDGATDWTDWAIPANGSETKTIAVAVSLPVEVGNEYQGKTASVVFKVEAVQANADLSTPWNGSSDTRWYNETDTEFTLDKPEQLAGLADLVDGGNTFEGKTVRLGSDMDLYLLDENGERVSFDPIGYGYNVVFKGTFDGQGHTISNLYQNGWALGYSYSTEAGGLFASVVDATFKNINIDGAEIVMECIDMGTLVGYSYGNCTYENITVSNSKLGNYQRYTGGVVGEVNGVQTFTNVDVDASTKVMSLWGDFDTSVGGIVGGKYGDATLTFTDCDVACELDVFNDVTSANLWYAYRRAGMLIGNSEETKTESGRTVATASYLTAENCTVTYGDWANYTYCEFTRMDYPYARVQGSEQNAPYRNPRCPVAIDANGNPAVDDTHVHNDGEDHNIPLTFDQLYGGGQGVYGGTEHDGVTVYYPNGNE